MCSAEDVGMEPVELVPGGERESLVGMSGWLAGLVGGVSVSWQYCCSLVAASEFPSMVFTAGVGGGEGDTDMYCTDCALVVEGRWEEGWPVVSGGGSGSLFFADWTTSDCSPS